MAAPQCRPGCGACCIAPSITSAIPGMPQGKPAGVRCVQLRPAVCAGLKPSVEMCGDTREQALVFLGTLERATAPA
jgi:Fe-S-cluster containining protein